MSSLVSILTPSFNQGRWLADNLKSVACQSYPAIEHIVMDGGSTDGTLQILQHSGDHVRWWSEPDRGQSHALNKAFEQSQGEVIGWLNSDDAYVDKRAIERVVDCFHRNPDVGVVYGHGLLVNASNKVLSYLWAPRFNPSTLRLAVFFVQPSVFMRRSILTSPLVSEDLHYVMDRDLWLRLLNRTTFHRVDTVIGLDRLQPSRKTRQEGYLIERRTYTARQGINPDSKLRRFLQQSHKLLYRYRGLIPAVRLQSIIDPTMELDFGSGTERAILQLFTPRNRMPLE